MTRIEQLTKEHEKMRLIQKKYSDLGALDTEPDSHYQFAVADALRGESFKDKTAEGWELFYDMDGVGAAAREMNKQTKKVVDLILGCPVGELQPVIDWVEKTMWRVTV